ncbi:hypothetical protein Y013_21255 [Rhodococcus pyridinivorans SB3094]|uniref:Uncharacterized protein n=1 Tax=Rhodococcus pyridinivorans SB3094 TaxID=1435356 RepID=V9XPB6_9NOCA|nr:hypothetical protein Y013_21255 [Rhodococcus pyridinivorans SB3094]
MLDAPRIIGHRTPTSTRMRPVAPADEGEVTNE